MSVAPLPLTFVSVDSLVQTAINTYTVTFTINVNAQLVNGAWPTGNDNITLSLIPWTPLTTSPLNPANGTQYNYTDRDSVPGTRVDNVNVSYFYAPGITLSSPTRPYTTFTSPFNATCTATLTDTYTPSTNYSASRQWLVSFFIANGAALSSSNYVRIVYGQAIAMCFLKGTFIRTPVGDTLVEDLKDGDDVITVGTIEDNLVERPHEPTTKQIKYIYHSLKTDMDEETRPVRVSADALGPGLPSTDLSLSKHHGIIEDGKLVAIRHLVNGTTIKRVEEAESAEYFHIKMDEHSVLIANGIRTESMLG